MAFLPGAERVLMVAGTHGKTTSTAIMAHVLDAAGRDPSMLVGGVAKDFGSNYRLGAGDDFVIEGDEYDTRSSTRDRSFCTIARGARSLPRSSSTTPTSIATSTT